MSNRRSFVFIYVVFMGNRFGQSFASFDYSILSIVTQLEFLFGYFGYLNFRQEHFNCCASGL